MGLLDNMARSFGIDILPGEYRLTAFGSRLLYAEGVKCVRGFSATEIILGLKGCSVKISGEGLEIVSLCGGDAVIKGKVKGLERI